MRDIRLDVRPQAVEGRVVGAVLPELGDRREGIVVWNLSLEKIGPHHKRLQVVSSLFARAEHRELRRLGSGTENGCAGSQFLIVDCSENLSRRAQQIQLLSNCFDNFSAIGTLSEADFEKEVWTQRYLELCYENKMWFDMVRTRKVRNDITLSWDDFIGHTTVWGKTFTEKELLFAIPQREISNNTSLTQNPGF